MSNATLLHTRIADIDFHNVVMNAAGVHCQSAEELHTLSQSHAATFVTKTATLSPREGNPLPRYYDFGLNSINSMGLPNYGLDYYLDYLTQESPELSATRFLSISPLQHDDLPQLLTQIQQSGFNGFVELNLSCPNVPGKPQTAYDRDYTAQLLHEVFSLYSGKLGVKLPPYFDMVHFDQMSEVLNQFPLTFVNCINSIGNGLYIVDDTMAISPKNGFGGLGGPMIKSTALANVHAFYTRLKSDIAIIGTGGVHTGRDVFEHILCGASMVQVGTALHQEGPQIFARLSDELRHIMQQKGYTSIHDFRGKVNYLI